MKVKKRQLVGSDGQPRGFPVDLREFCLVHFQNLSTEVCSYGLVKEYEPALDRLMNWLYWEFSVHHPQFKEEFETTMNFRFGDLTISNVDKVKRIQMKERLLSRLLAEHNIDLGKGQEQDEEYEPEQWTGDEIDRPKKPSGPDMFDNPKDTG